MQSSPLLNWDMAMILPNNHHTNHSVHLPPLNFPFHHHKLHHFLLLPNLWTEDCLQCPLHHFHQTYWCILCCFLSIAFPHHRQSCSHRDHSSYQFVISHHLIVSLWWNISPSPRFLQFRCRCCGSRYFEGINTVITNDFFVSLIDSCR